MKTLFLLAWLSSAASSAPSGEGTAWIDDFELAKKLAAEQGKDILMEFTGSDWCPPCIRLTDEVFSTEEFQIEASNRYVLLVVDNPRGEDVITPEVRAQNDRLHEIYAVNSWPTIILADAEGRPYARTEDYREGGPRAYLEHLATLQPLKAKRDELLRKARESEGVERARLLHEALSVGGEFIPMEPYRDIVDEIIAADADDEAGLKMYWETRRAHDRLEVDLPRLGKAGRWKELAERIGDFLERYEPAPPVRQKALYWRGVALSRLGDLEAARESFRDAVAIDAEAEFGSRSADMLKRMGG